MFLLTGMSVDCAMGRVALTAKPHTENHADAQTEKPQNPAEKELLAVR